MAEYKRGLDTAFADLALALFTFFKRGSTKEDTIVRITGEESRLHMQIRTACEDILSLTGVYEYKYDRQHGRLVNISKMSAKEQAEFEKAQDHTENLKATIERLHNELRESKCEVYKEAERRRVQQALHRNCLREALRKIEKETPALRISDLVYNAVIETVRQKEYEQAQLQKKMQVNLNCCRRGQKLLSKHGLILSYLEKDNRLYPFNHVVLYPKTKGLRARPRGTRTDDGCVAINKPLPQDHDIIEILPWGYRVPKDNTFDSF